MDSKTTSGWEHFSHVADLGVRGWGSSPDQAFAQAALAMTAAVTEIENVVARDPVSIRCEAPDLEMLLVDWLNAIVYEMATRKMLFSRFEPRIDDQVLTARIWGEPVARARHHPAVEVKGATYTELAVQRKQSGTWIAQCVVDV